MRSNEDSTRSKSKPIGGLKVESSRLKSRGPIGSPGGVFESEAKEGGERVLLGVVWRLAARC